MGWIGTEGWEYELADKIAGKSRREAEEILVEVGFRPPNAAAAVAMHTGARSQTVVDDVEAIAYTLIRESGL